MATTGRTLACDGGGGGVRCIVFLEGEVKTTVSLLHTYSTIRKNELEENVRVHVFQVGVWQQFSDKLE